MSSRTGSAAVVLLIVLLFATACGGGASGSGVASLGAASPSPSSAGGAGASGGTSALAFSECMRAHGIKDFPDPSSNGAINLNGAPGSDLNQNDPRYMAAFSACRSLLPPGQSSGSGQNRIANLNYAKCMRAHGISDFPDPKADGSLALSPTPGSDLDPSNPQYQKADSACKHLEAGGGGTVTSGNGGGA